MDVSQLFDTSNFPPRWDCGTWTAAHGWTHIVADLLVFGAYMAIPLVLGAYALRRRDLAFKGLFALFCAFIFACGTTHLVEATLFWQPWYRLSAAMKVVTAVVSWGTVFALVRVAPRAADLPSVAELSAIVHSSEDAIVCETLDGRITSWNRGAERLYGYTADEVVGRPVSILVPEDREGELTGLLVRLTRGEPVQSVETVRVRKDGTRVDVSLTVTSILDPHGRPIGASAIARDITASKQAERDLRRLSAELEAKALQDPLTGFPNRRGLEQELTKALSRAGREGSSVVAILVDLDDFKAVNDALGHSAGDVLLRAAAERMASCLRPEDTLARVGGDEYLVLLPDTRLAEGERVAERLRLAVADSPVTIAGSTLRLTASLGFALVGRDVLSVEELFDATRLGLSRSKSTGKNRVALAHPGAAVPDDGDGLDRDVDQVLRADALEVHRQPILDLASGVVVAHEYLVRGPEGPYRAPNDLFRLSIEHNQLTRADLLCLKTCVARAGAARNGRAHLNLYPSTLLDTPVPRLVELLEKWGGPHAYCVELSEQQFLGDPASLRGPIDELRRAGIQVALDDVGFGRSSLEALVVLEPDVVKLDRSYVHGAATRPGGRRLLERLVHTIRGLGPELVAEGLEEEADRELLVELDVPLAQGYLFGRPEPFSAD